MTWRKHTWELMVGVLSWIVAIVALVFVVAYLVYATIKSRRTRSARK